MKQARRRQVLKDAWIGDAVLTLYVRSKILREDNEIDGGKSARMTSNQFLTAFGEASEVEAEIGRAYEAGGLEAAYAWIESRIMPAYARQEENRLAGSKARRKPKLPPV